MLKALVSCDFLKIFVSLDYTKFNILHGEKKLAINARELWSRFNNTHFPWNISMAASVDGKVRHHGQ